MPARMGGVHGRGVASAIFDLADSFDQPHAVLLSLDLRKGHDFADPEIIIGHMKHRGLPLQWCRYFEHMWCNQSRWIVWDRHVSPEPEKVARSTPQGDPFAVIGFCLLLAEASHDFDLHHHGDAAQALFVDDRSLVVNHPSQLRPVYDHWTEWSNRLGFQENLDKLAIVCASPGDEAEVLQQGFSADNVRKETCVLGVDFIQRGHHEEGDTARTRRLTALKMLKRLQTAPLGTRIREVLASTRILPKACWGLWLHSFQESRKFGTQVKFAVRAHRSGSRHLWELFSGPVACPSMYSLQHSFGCFADGFRYWSRLGRPLTGGGWWKSLRDSLHRLGFLTADNGFRHQDVGQITWPPPEGALFHAWRERSRHMLREAFRRRHFQSFLDSERRDSRQLVAHVEYNEQVVTSARQLYQAGRLSARAVMLGAALSSLCYSRIRRQPDSQVCQWCCREVRPNWEHLVWHCSYFAETRPDPLPVDPMTLRLGWPSRPLNRGRSGALLEHMALVRETIRRAEGFTD